jgi:Glycosyltransferase family 9 (heptosyltransferase)
MGYGDELIATGLARGAAARGKRIAFGDGQRIIWSEQSHQLFRGNPNIAPPGETRDLQWIPHYRGRRLYGEVQGSRWVFRDFECPPGEVFLTKEERIFALARVAVPADPVVVIEPRVKPRGASAGANKQWPVARYQQIAGWLFKIGCRPVQLVPPDSRPLLDKVDVIRTPSFRHALAVVGLARLYVGPEGGLHHGAAAMQTPAVVIFGGFNTPRSTGYSWHHNITRGEPCGQIAACDHCRQAMASIGIGDVRAAIERSLYGAAVPGIVAA